jgi:exosortase/archaeosortase family protein
VLGPWRERGARLGPAQAAATAAVLDLAGIHVAAAGDTIEGAGFAMRVAPVCDGLDLALILSLAMLVSPVRWAARLFGVVLAAVLSQLLNVIRLASMFAVGVFFPSSFDLVHQLVWQVGSIVAAVGVYVVWIDRAVATIDAP